MADTTRFAIPGENFAQYQSRLGRSPSTTPLPKPDLTFDASDMSSAAPLGIPQVKPETSSSGLAEFVGSAVLAPYQAEREREMQQLQGEVKAGQKGIKGVFDKLMSRGARQEEVLAEQGVDRKRKAVDEITSQIEAERASSARRIEELRLNPQGLFGGALEDEIARVTRESAKTQADLGIVLSASNRAYDTAAAIAERQLQAEFEPLKDQLDYLKFFYNENSDRLSKKDDQRYRELIAQEERAYDEKLTEKKALTSVKLKLIEEAAERGAPASVLRGIQSSTTLEGAYGAAGSYAQKQVTGAAEEEDVTMQDVLVSNSGADGFVEPAFYNKMRREWVAAGRKLNEFDNNFKVFQNPNDEGYDG